MVIREKGLVAILETSVQRAMGRAVEDIPDLIIIDVNDSHDERIALCKKFRALSSSPILLFLPAIVSTYLSSSLFTTIHTFPLE